MASVINLLFGKAFDLLLFPFQSLNPWVGMTVVSLVAGLLMLAIYGYISNQEGIKEVKDKIKAHLLELRLYKDNFRATTRAQKEIFRYNGKYLYCNLKPMVVMMVPFVLIIIQLDLWFGYRPLNPGESVMVKVKMDQDPMQSDLTLHVSPGLEIETPALRIESEKEMDWRVKGLEAGVQTLTVSVAGQSFTKQLVVSGKPLTKISQARVANRFLDRLMSPAEPPIPPNVPVNKVEILYAGQEMSLLGYRMHWIFAFFILSIVFGFGLKGFFGVEV